MSLMEASSYSHQTLVNFQYHIQKTFYKQKYRVNISHTSGLLLVH